MKATTPTKVSSWLVFVLTISLLEQSWGNRENFISANNACPCPNDVLMYTCTVVNGTSTIWSGSAFICSGNQIILIHNQFSAGESGECNNGAIIGQGIPSNDSCYTSQLTVRLSSELNGRSIQCVGKDIIGNATLSVTSVPLPPPTSISLDIVDRDTLMFNWNSVISNCLFNYRTSFDCGECESSPQETTVTCSSLQLSTIERNCNFSVQTVVCSNIVGSASSLIVTLKVPDVPNIDVLPVYFYDNQTLSSLSITISRTATFNITAGKSGSVKAHNVSYNYDNQNFQYLINSSFGTFDVPTSSCPAQSSINVSLTAVNVLGEGPPSDPVIFGCSNQFVRVMYNSDTSSLMCVFMNKLDTSTKSCSVTYGQCDTEMKQSTRIEDSNGTALTLTLQEFVSPICFTVIASNSTVTVFVKGTIEGSNVGGSTIAVVVAVVVPVVMLLIIAVIIIAIFVVLYYKGRLKNISFQRLSFNMSPAQALDEIKSPKHDESKMNEASNTATSATENSEHEVELESQMQKERKKVTKTASDTLTDPESHATISAQEANKSSGIKIFDTLKWRLDLKEVTGRRLVEVKVTNDSKLQDCVAGFKRGHVYYEFCHEIESVSEDQELIFMKVDGSLYYPNVKVQLLYEEGLLGEELTRPNFGDYRVFVQYWGSGARYLPSRSSLLLEIFEKEPFDGVHLPLCGIISEHFKAAAPEEDISLGDFRKEMPEIRGRIFVDISTFLRGGGGPVIDVILKSKVSGTLITGPSARHVVKEYCQHNLEVVSEMKTSEGEAQDNQSLVTSSEGDVLSGTNPDNHYSEIDKTIRDWDSEWIILVLAKFGESMMLTKKKLILYENSQIEKFLPLEVDEDIVQMREYVTKKLNVSFENGRAYYQFTPGECQDLLYFKNVVCVNDKEFGEEIFTLTKFDDFYEVLGAPSEKIKLKVQSKKVFIQSCSHGSRCLKKGDKLLYKVEDEAEAHR